MTFKIFGMMNFGRIWQILSDQSNGQRYVLKIKATMIFNSISKLLFFLMSFLHFSFKKILIQVIQYLVSNSPLVMAKLIKPLKLHQAYLEAVLFIITAGIDFLFLE